jgi:hypothetical protein
MKSLHPLSEAGPGYDVLDCLLLMHSRKSLYVQLLI